MALPAREPKESGRYLREFLLPGCSLKPGKKCAESIRVKGVRDGIEVGLYFFRRLRKPIFLDQYAG